MPLTIQQDGSQVGGQPNTVVAKWWNDYHDLLTGAMTDQDVTLHTDLILGPLGGNPAAPTAAAQAGTGLGVGSYTYGITFLKQGQSGESLVGTTTNVTTTSGNQAVGLSAIPVGPAGTIARNIYRSKVGGGTLYYVAQLANNTATTYVDTTPDASLTVASPNRNTFGGRLILKDGSGAVTIYLLEDGSISTIKQYTWAASVGTQILDVLTIAPTDAGQKQWSLVYNGTDQHLQIQQETNGYDILDFDTVGNAQLRGTLTSAGINSSAGIFQQGSEVALTGAHGAGQVALSYGSGVPATLGSNEIYFQIS